MSVVIVLSVAVMVLTAVAVWLAAGWWETRRQLREALERADAAEDAAEGFVAVLRGAGLLNIVDTCQRTRRTS